MGVCYLYSGGGNDRLPLFPVTGLTQPENPAENTLWIPTELENPQYLLCSGELTLPEDDSREKTIWIRTDPRQTGQQISLPLGSRASLRLDLSGCRICQDGSWNNAEAWLYTKGSWVKFSHAWAGVLYEQGDSFPSVTGGWVLRCSNHTSASYATSPNLSSVGTTKNQIYTANAIDLTDYTRLCFTGICTGNDRDGTQYPGQLGVLAQDLEEGQWPSEDLAAFCPGSAGEQTFSVDISQLTGAYHIYACVRGNQQSTLRFSKIWLE